MPADVNQKGGLDEGWHGQLMQTDDMIQFKKRWLARFPKVMDGIWQVLLEGVSVSIRCPQKYAPGIGVELVHIGRYFEDANPTVWGTGGQGGNGQGCFC